LLAKRNGVRIPGYPVTVTGHNSALRRVLPGAATGWRLKSLGREGGGNGPPRLFAVVTPKPGDFGIREGA
jgi:hypothetical protein